MVNLSKMKKEKIYFYNGEIKEELKIPQSFFPKDKKKIICGHIVMWNIYV